MYNVFITGGTKGIGETFVKECLYNKFNVAYTTQKFDLKTKDQLSTLKKEFPEQTIECYELDVRNSLDVDKIVSQAMDDFTHFDGLICNAGIAFNNLLISTSDEEWNEVLNVNLSGAFYVSRAFISHFLIRKAGAIVFMGSLNRDGAAGNVAYAASKAGLEGLSGTIAKEYGKKGIRSNVIAPGFVDTSMTIGKLPEKIEKFWKDFSPAGRFIKSKEVVDVGLFLLSDKSRMVNGAVIPVTSGLNWRP